MKGIFPSLSGVLYLALALCWFILPGPASAHEIGIAELTLTETAQGSFVWKWGAPLKGRSTVEGITPLWPEGCIEDHQTLNCSQGLVGRIGVDGLSTVYSAAIIRIHWRQNEETAYTLTRRETSAQVYGGPRDTRAWDAVAKVYFLLGIEHILTGTDHLMFVISLLCLVGFRRQLLVTITAFTVAHSITLIFSALGLLVVRSPPTEACIALSIALVASEALSDHKTLTRRWPMVVAFIFGLVHGLGFAGALKETGLPEQHLPTALLTFNLGVEAGQIMVLALAGLLTLAASRLPAQQRLRQAVLYGIGTSAVYWSIDRIMVLIR